MLKKCLSLIAMSCACSFSSVNSEIASCHIIDVGRDGTIDNGYYTSFNPEAWNLGFYAFNYAPELTTVFARLKYDQQIDTVFETGTFLGGTTSLFALLFDEVHTADINPDFHAAATSNFKNFRNVHCHLGSSENVLNQVLPSLTNKRVLFYLDAHWNDYWPLLDELKEISKTHRDNCVIVIDDFKVPNRTDIPYDFYGPHECSFEYIQKALNSVYSSYDAFFLIPKSVNSRAKFIAIPHKWKKKPTS